MRIARAAADVWIDLVGLVSPRAAFACAGAERQLVRRLLRTGPNTADVARFFEFDRADAEVVARQMASSIGRNRVLRQLAMRRGLEAVTPWFAPGATDGIAEVSGAGQPAILVVVPQGPRIAVAAALHSLRMTALVVANLPRQPYASWGLDVHAPSAAQGQSGGPALKAAVDRLRNGGCVVAAIEGQVGHVIAERPFLGGGISLRPGIAAMARIGRAPVYPLAVRWSAGDTSVEVAIGAALRPDPGATDTEASDGRLMTALCNSIEDAVRAVPGQCDLRFLRACLGASPQSDTDESFPER